MTNKVTFELSSTDVKQKFVIIDPELIDNPGGEMSSNGVYRIYLQATPDKYIGDFAIHQGHDDWVYTGYELNDSEQEQLAAYIYSYELEHGGEAPFTVRTFYNGDITDLEIIPNEGHFGIAYNGNLIAEVQRNEDWEQTMGDPLDSEAFSAIIDRIEDHYE